MFRSIVVLLALAWGASTSLAASKWNGTGWYQIGDDFEYAEIIAGPFPDKSACEATLPPNDEEFDYVCNFLDAKPKWDR